VVVLVLSGCGGDDGGSDEVDAGATTSTTSPTEDSTDGTEVPGTTLPGPTVSVAEAIEQPDGTTLTVLANVFRPEEGATVLCDLFAESFPPSCSGATLATDGLDVDALPGIQTTAPGDLVAPATWTSAPVPITGTLTAGRLVVSS
jgi:hypothetical protein